MSEGKTDRERRLAQALRANLRRRKGQARERDETDAAQPDAAESDPTDTVGDDKM